MLISSDKEKLKITQTAHQPAQAVFNHLSPLSRGRSSSDRSSHSTASEIHTPGTPNPQRMVRTKPSAQRHNSSAATDTVLVKAASPAERSAMGMT